MLLDGAHAPMNSVMRRRSEDDEGQDELRHEQVAVDRPGSS
jgi:hypothetical protein